MRISDEILDMLGDYFEENEMQNKGWTFEQFVEEYERGYISVGEVHLHTILESALSESQTRIQNLNERD